MGWLYRNPDGFRNALTQLPRRKALQAFTAVYIYTLPWFFLIAVACQMFLFEAGLAHSGWADLSVDHRFLRASSLVALSAIGGVTCGLLVGMAVVFFVSLEAGLIVALVIGLGCGLVLILGGFSLIFGVVMGLALGLIGGRTGGFSFGLAVGGVVGLAFGMANNLTDGLNAFGGLLLGYYRSYYILCHGLYWFLRRSPNAYRFHPAAWDWLCWTSFPWFDRLLVKYGELDGGRMEPEIQRLIREVPGQRAAALRALVILRARTSARVPTLYRLSEVLADLPEGEKGMLVETRRVRELAELIVQQQIRVDATSQPYFREIECRSLAAEIRNFQSRIGGLAEPLAAEFSVAADSWLKLAEVQLGRATESVRAEPAPPVFRPGDPVAGASEAFVPRFRVLEELEGQIMLGNGCPGLLLRAPRRMGKSSLLKNVSGFLPVEVSVTFLSMQSARLFSSAESFAGGVVASVGSCLPPLDTFGSLKQNAKAHPPHDLAGFLRFLHDVNGALERTGRRLLLAFDEYEMLDEKLQEGVFTKDLLATIRESIQSHRRIIWVFSGNADITELTGADWTSYLISVRTVEIPLFTPQETHLLLTEPLKHSTLRPEDKMKSALFWREFWGESGIARVHVESGGWPNFVQLIAETVVALANVSASGAKPVPPALLERALDESVARGRNVFYQLLRAQCRVPGEWMYLSKFSRCESQPPPSDPAVRQLLKRRQLLTETPMGEWRLVVPLMARWLKRED